MNECFISIVDQYCKNAHKKKINGVNKQMTKLFVETLMLIQEMVYKVMWDFSLLDQAFQHQPVGVCGSVFMC